MTRWKAAGAAPRGVDEALWRRFRAAQDTFFGAKQAVNAAQDVEFRANAGAKAALLDEAEARILPVTDLATARVAYRELLERWSAIGKVPRDAMRPLDNRLRAIESAVTEAEERPLAPDQPGGPGPRRGHRGQARGADRRARGAGRRRPRPAATTRPPSRRATPRRPTGSGSPRRSRRRATSAARARRWLVARPSRPGRCVARLAERQTIAHRGEQPVPGRRLARRGTERPRVVWRTSVARRADTRRARWPTPPRTRTSRTTASTGSVRPRSR